MRKTILLVLLLACEFAQAAEWVQVGKGDNYSDWLADTASIRIDGVTRLGLG